MSEANNKQNKVTIRFRKPNGDHERIDLDSLLTPAEFAEVLNVDESWVRRRLGILPGVIRNSRKVVHIHLRKYVESAASDGRKIRGATR